MLIAVATLEHGQSPDPMESTRLAFVGSAKAVRRVKDFRPIRNSHDGTCFSRSVLGALFRPNPEACPREVILAKQVEVLPGNRRGMATSSRNASRLAVP
jgi:hypothetical protein